MFFLLLVAIISLFDFSFGKLEAMIFGF